MQAHLRWLAGATAIALASGCASASRDDGQRPDEVIALLGIGPGDRVADLGADGDFAPRLAEAVGETGHVYAVDVTALRGDPADPHLPDGEIDLVLLYDTYSRIEGRADFLHRLLDDLAPNGRVAIVDATPSDEVAREMRAAGYEPRGRYETQPDRSFSIFRADDGTGE